MNNSNSHTGPRETRREETAAAPTAEDTEMQSTDEARCDVLTIDEHDLSWKTGISKHLCKVLRFNAHLNPSDLGIPFSVLLYEKMGIVWPPNPEHHSTAERSKNTVMVVSTDSDSDIQSLFTIFPFGHGPKTIHLLRNPDIERLCIIRLSINVFALETVAPMTGVLPLRQKQDDENRPRCVLAHECDSCFMVSDAPDRPQIRISVSQLQWRLTESGLSGPCGLTTVIMTRFPDALSEKHHSFTFGRLLWSSHSGIMISKFNAYGTVLYVNVVHELDPTIVIPDNCDTLPAPRELSLRIELFNIQRPGPYFSAVGSPYFRTPIEEDCIEITAPYDFHTRAGLPHNIRIHRKHYGNFLGIFVPTSTSRMCVTAAIWNPRSWLDIAVLSARDETVYYGEVLGRVYFVPSTGTVNASRMCQFSNGIRSKVSESDGNKSVCVLGLKYKLQDLPMVMLNRSSTQPDALTTLNIESAATPR